eukprot:14297-Heterococcus_DN1.PRE.2
MAPLQGAKSVHGMMQGYKGGAFSTAGLHSIEAVSKIQQSPSAQTIALSWTHSLIMHALPQVSRVRTCAIRQSSYVSASLLYSHKTVVRHYGQQSGPAAAKPASSMSGRNKPRVDRAFLVRAIRLCKVMVPGWKTPEAAWL